MPCGHTEEEFDEFTRVERRILRMVDVQTPREKILQSLVIVDSTLRMHLANIKRKQAQMRLARANARIAEDQKRQKEKYLPEMDDPVPVEMEPPPITHPTSLPPVRGKAIHRSPFEVVPEKKWEGASSSPSRFT